MSRSALYGTDASRISASIITTASLSAPNAIIPTMSNSGGTVSGQREAVVDPGHFAGRPLDGPPSTARIRGRTTSTE